MAAALAIRPERNRMFGITHQLDGSPIIREPRILKVSIGAPKGRAILVFIAPNDAGDPMWKITIGYKGKGQEPKTYAYKTREEAEKAYAGFVASNQVPNCPFPRKLGFFAFTRPTVEGFEPAWDAIEAHGSKPTEIDIVFLDDDPLEGAYQMWSSSELRCKGDGVNAMRVCSMARGPQEQDLARAAMAAGEKTFPIIDGCWMKGCEYSKEKDGKPSLCKPGADLKFQLARKLKVGGTAYFHTTGFRSISQLYSALWRFRALTGGGDQSRGYLAGIPFKMVLRPYKTNHNGQAATQYGVSLEFRAETVEALQREMLEQGLRFRQALLPTGGPQRVQTRQISAPVAALPPAQADTEEIIDPGDEDEATRARAMADEFYPGADNDGEEHQPTPATVGSSAAMVTESKADELRARLQQQSANVQARNAGGAVIEAEHVTESDLPSQQPEAEERLTEAELAEWTDIEPPVEVTELPDAAQSKDGDMVRYKGANWRFFEEASAWRNIDAVVEQTTPTNQQPIEKPAAPQSKPVGRQAKGRFNF